jgi:HK97 family phage major capsid protein
MAGMSIENREARLREIAQRLSAIHDEHRGEKFPEHVRAEWNELHEEKDAHKLAIAELRVRQEALRDAAADPRNLEPTDPPRTRHAGTPDKQIVARDASVYEWCRERGFTGSDGRRLHLDRPPSFGAYLRGVCTGNWDGAEQERALSEGTLTAGGHLVPSPLSSRVIDLARNASRVFQAGAVTVPMLSKTEKVARLTGEGAPAWHAENAAVTDQDLTFDAVTFEAKTLVRVVKLSVELFEDADPRSEDVIAKSFAEQLALELDRAALRGSGVAPEPDGVLNQTGVTITTHGANGAAITNYDFWLDAVGTVRNNNHEPNAQIQAPRSATSLSKLKEATTNAYMTPPAALADIPRLNSKQIPTNLTVGTSTDCSEIYTAQWDQLWIGMRTEFNLQFMREAFLADNLQYGFVAYLRADVQLAHPAAFVVDTGVRG